MTTCRSVAPLLLFLLAAAAAGVEQGPYPVLRVIDGDTVVIRVEETERLVRLLWIDTPESRRNAHGEALPEGAHATQLLTTVFSGTASAYLWSPEPALRSDRYGRLLAVLYQSAPTQVPREQGAEVSVNEQIIAAGWSVYWRKYGTAPATSVLHHRLLAAEAAAQSSSSGAWGSIPVWMRDKSHERTAPRAELPATSQPLAGALAVDEIEAAPAADPLSATGHPPVAENGDRAGVDNDGDGIPETRFVPGYYRRDGTYVRSHYSAER